ncbi:MAG: hypothetical protein OES57_15060, partial [Acidimicrobiia bacterium]|nr:hypothetical protein [Acidimicrobiia bacterium]
MSDPSTLTEARQAYDERRWADAVTAYESAGPIELSDAERLAWAQLWTFAPAHDCLDAFERLEQAALEAGDREVAARAALEQVRMHAMLDNGVLTGSCYQRASKHAGAGTAVSRMVRFYSALGLLASGDHGAAAAIASELLPQARAAGDVTLEALATWAIGSDTVMNGAVDDGLAQLDQAMTMAITQPVHPLYAAMITCGVVVTCRAIGDWNRAKEWTEAADRYCHREAVCHYPGHCSIFRAETRRLDGELDAASREASKALELAGDWARAWTGMAHHQQGEAELCRGDLGRAQAAFTRAIEAGHPPQPGLARLHLAAGDPTAALRSISETIDSAGAYTDADRLLTLSAAVSIALAADDRDAATRWSDQLEHGCSRFGTTAWRAATAQAKGELALADLDAASAEQHLRAATTEWS